MVVEREKESSGDLNISLTESMMRRLLFVNNTPL